MIHYAVSKQHKIIFDDEMKPETVKINNIKNIFIWWQATKHVRS